MFSDWYPHQRYPIKWQLAYLITLNLVKTPASPSLVMFGRSQRRIAWSMHHSLGLGDEANHAYVVIRTPTLLYVPCCLITYCVFMLYKMLTSSYGINILKCKDTSHDEDLHVIFTFCCASFHGFICFR